MPQRVKPWLDSVAVWRRGLRAVLTACVGVGWVWGMGAVEGGAAEPSTGAVAPGTQRMAQRLEQIAKATNPLEVRFLAADQVPVLQSMMAKDPALALDFSFRYRLAEALLNASRNREAREAWEWVVRKAEEPGSAVEPQAALNASLNLALSHLREAEVLNCVSNHNADSCLFPLQGGGVHRWKEPSKSALNILTALLEKHPEHLGARWLLNVAAMTVGDYPAGVPAKWLIPESAFASEAPFPRFREVAPASGLAVNDLSGGMVVEDFDGDELLDVMVTSIGLRDPMRLFRNLGNGQFAERTAEAGLTGLTGGLNMVQADYDNDGDADVLVLRGAWMGEQGRHPNSLLRNRGDGTFEDVTEAAGMLSFHPTQTAVWFDFDGDGWLDLYIGNESTVGRPRHPQELYRNQGDGTFKEMAARAGVSAIGFVKGVTSGDFNNDGRPDLYLSVLGGRNRLYRNDGPVDPAAGAPGGWVFTEVADAAGVTEPVWSFPCWFFDYDNDGWEDLWVSGYRISGVGDVAADVLGLPHTGTRMRLFRNRGDGGFAEVTAASHLDRLVHAMGSNFGDLDNDGWLDFYAGTGDPDLMTLIPNRMFRNAEGRLFQDVTTAGGFGHLQKGHGVVFADVDNDGDQDVLENLGGAVSGDVYPDVLFENPGFDRHWLKLRLEGRRANRAGVGARVRVDLEEGGRDRSIHRTLSSGGSFGANPLRMELGLGRATRIRAVEILWPGSGTRQRVEGLDLDRAYVIREGESAPRPVGLKRFKLPAAGDHAAHRIPGAGPGR